MESVFEKDQALARNIKLYLCQRYTSEKLKDIGKYFGIGESGVSQACRRVAQKIDRDKKLNSDFRMLIRFKMWLWFDFLREKNVLKS